MASLSGMEASSLLAPRPDLSWHSWSHFKRWVCQEQEEEKLKSKVKVHTKVFFFFVERLINMVESQLGDGHERRY